LDACRLTDWGDQVSEVVAVPVDTGGRLLFEMTAEGASSELQLASPKGPDAIRQTSRSLEGILDELTPALRVVFDRLARTGPDEVQIQFGLKLGTEANLIIARGTSSVHFDVTLHWRRSQSTTAGADGLVGPQA
jgi:hypothetical protein